MQDSTDHISGLLDDMLKNIGLLCEIQDTLMLTDQEGKFVDGLVQAALDADLLEKENN